MIRYERFVRALPTVLLFCAAVDFVKQCLLLASSWESVRYLDGLNGGDGLYSKIVFALLEQVFGVILYPLGWVASAMILIVLLSIYDRGFAANAQG